MRAYPSPAYRYPSSTLRAYQRALAGLSVILAVVVACLAADGGFLDSPSDASGAVGQTARPAGSNAPGATSPSMASPPRPAPPDAGPSSQATAPLPVLLDAAAIESVVRGALAPFPGRFSVAILDPTHGRNVSVGPGEVFYAASTFKLALLYEALVRISDGRLAPSTALVITEEARAEDEGTLALLPLDADGALPVRDALFWMVARSDNATAHALGRLMGYGAVDETLRRLGIQTMSVNTRELPTTADDLAILMRAIVTGLDLSPEAQALGRELLLAQQWRDGIPAAIPPGIPVGNKTGNVSGATHDVAFVDAPGATYILAVLSDRDWDWRPMIAVAAAVHEALAPQPADVPGR